MSFGDPRLPERFWAKISPTTPTNCWFWLGETNPGGYGRFWYKKRKRMAHKVAYEAFKNKRIRRTIDHKCVNPACVNPKHLQEVTQRKNNLLSIARRASK